MAIILFPNEQQYRCSSTWYCGRQTQPYQQGGNRNQRLSRKESEEYSTMHSQVANSHPKTYGTGEAIAETSYNTFNFLQQMITMLLESVGAVCMKAFRLWHVCYAYEPNWLWIKGTVMFIWNCKQTLSSSLSTGFPLKLEHKLPTFPSSALPWPCWITLMDRKRWSKKYKNKKSFQVRKIISLIDASRIKYLSHAQFDGIDYVIIICGTGKARCL